MWEQPDARNDPSFVSMYSLQENTTTSEDILIYWTNVLKTILDGKVKGEQQQDVDTDVDVKITCESEQDTDWFSAPSWRGSQETWDLLPPTFVLKTAQDDDNSLPSRKALSLEMMTTEGSPHFLYKALGLVKPQVEVWGLNVLSSGSKQLPNQGRRTISKVLLWVFSGNVYRNGLHIWGNLTQTVWWSLPETCSRSYDLTKPPTDLCERIMVPHPKRIILVFWCARAYVWTGDIVSTEIVVYKV